MPFNGTGTYVPPSPPTFPAVPATTISSTYFNSTILDLATALSNTLTRDGQGKPSANIDWNAKNLTNVGVFSAVSGTINGGTIWSSANDGTGSGLDADLLDGKHAADFLLVANYTAADVLAKLLTVDGAGSGLDADLLDGQHGAFYAPAAGTSLVVSGTGYLGVPPSPQSGGYTLAQTDLAKHIYYTGAAAALTIPPIASVAFEIGSVVTIVNNGSGVLTITRGAGVSLIWAGVGTNADRALAISGMCTILKVAADIWFVSGAGLS